MSLSELMYGPHVLVCVRVRGAFQKKNNNKKYYSVDATSACGISQSAVCRILLHVHPLLAVKAKEGGPPFGHRSCVESTMATVSASAAPAQCSALNGDIDQWGRHPCTFCWSR